MARLRKTRMQLPTEHVVGVILCASVVLLWMLSWFPGTWQMTDTVGGRLLLVLSVVALSHVPHYEWLCLLGVCVWVGTRVVPLWTAEPVGLEGMTSSSSAAATATTTPAAGTGTAQEVAAQTIQANQQQTVASSVQYPIPPQSANPTNIAATLKQIQAQNQANAVYDNDTQTEASTPANAAPVTTTLPSFAATGGVPTPTTTSKEGFQLVDQESILLRGKQSHGDSPDPPQSQEEVVPAGTFAEQWFGVW